MRSKTIFFFLYLQSNHQVIGQNISHYKSKKKNIQFKIKKKIIHFKIKNIRIILLLCNQYRYMYSL